MIHNKIFDTILLYTYIGVFASFAYSTWNEKPFINLWYTPYYSIYMSIIWTSCIIINYYNIFY